MAPILPSLNPIATITATYQDVMHPKRATTTTAHRLRRRDQESTALAVGLSLGLVFLFVFLFAVFYFSADRSVSDAKRSKNKRSRKSSRRRRRRKRRGQEEMEKGRRRRRRRRRRTRKKWIMERESIRRSYGRRCEDSFSSSSSSPASSPSGYGGWDWWRRPRWPGEMGDADGQGQGQDRFVDDGRWSRTIQVPRAWTAAHAAVREPPRAATGRGRRRSRRREGGDDYRDVHDFRPRHVMDAPRIPSEGTDSEDSERR